jgi:hypothetical protein
MSEENTAMNHDTDNVVSFDLSSVPVSKNAERGEWMPILHPKTGEATGLELLVHGEDSSRVKKTRNRILGVAQSKFKGKRSKATYDDVLETELMLVVGAVSDWRTKVGDAYRPYLYETAEKHRSNAPPRIALRCSARRAGSPSRWSSSSATGRISPRADRPPL